METNYCISHCGVWILIPFIQSQSRNSYIDQFYYNDGEEGWNEGKKWAGICDPYFFKKSISVDPH